MTIKNQQIKALQEFIDSLELEHSELTVTDIKGYDRQYEYWNKYDESGYNSCIIFKLNVHTLNTDLWVCLYQGIAYRKAETEFTVNYSTNPDDLLLNDSDMYFSHSTELNEELSHIVNELDSVLTEQYYNDSSLVYDLAEILYQKEYNEITMSTQKDKPVDKFKYDELLKFTEQIKQQVEQYGLK